MSELVRVLHIDDSATDRELVRDALEREHVGFELVQAASQTEMKARLAEAEYDVVLSDFNILGFDGLDVIDLVREEAPDVPVVIVTGTGSETIAVEAMKRGAADYVIKTPSHIRRLPLALQGVLEKARLQAERARSEAERVLLMSAIEQAGETVVITDATGAIQYANPAFERITGHSREEAIGQNTRILKSGKLDSAFYKKMWDALTRGETWRGRFTNKRKDGTLFEEDAVISPVRDSVGEIVNYVAVKRDVTKEVALEAQLRRAQKMEAIGQLAGGVAHDFNNLLTAILLNAETLLFGMDRDRPVTSEDLLRTGLEQIQSAGKQAASLTRQLLAFSRREITRPEVLDPKKIVREMEGMLWRLIGEHIQLDVRLSAETHFIHADPGQIEQIAMNLVANAADAMPDGGHLEIRVEGAELADTYVADHADAKPGRHVLLSVGDNGTGMTPDTLEHLFEPFFTTKPVGKGTGLGLATVYGTVKQMGGHVSVNSEPGVGSTFTVYLPAVDRKKMGKEPDGAPLRPCAGETILVCEDQEMVRNVMCQVLRAAGYTVIESDNGRQALEAMEAHDGTIDMLISDVVMPGMGGRELVDNLASEHPDMRVLFVSGYTAGHLGAHGVRGEPAGFLQKPFGPTALLRRVREILDQERAL